MAHLNKIVMNSVFVSVLLFASLSLLAQQHLIKVGGGPGYIPFGNNGLSINYELQYENKLTPRLSIFSSIGRNSDNYSFKGRSIGSNQSGSWNNSWKYDLSAAFIYLDLGLRTPLLRLGNSYELNLFAGPSYAFSFFKYPSYIYIDRGSIEEIEYTKHKVGTFMSLIGFEQVLKLTEQIQIGLSYNFRTTFKEKHVLKRMEHYDDGQSTTTSGISNVENLTLFVGYAF